MRKPSPTQAEQENASLRSQLSAAEAERNAAIDNAHESEMIAADVTNQLQAAREAMSAVPHLWTNGDPTSYEGAVYADAKPCMTPDERERCATLGGQCALAALRESKEGDRKISPNATASHRT